MFVFEFHRSCGFYVIIPPNDIIKSQFTVGGAVFTVGRALFTVGEACLQ